MNVSVLISTFLAATIEVIEMVAIVVAVGVTRSWRAARLGALAALVLLAVLIGELGTALQDVPLRPLRLVVGALLLPFGSQWLRKGILSVSRDGWATGSAEERVDDDVPPGFDWKGFVLSFKGVSLEGLEVAVIVVAFGAASQAFGSAVIGASRDRWGADWAQADARKVLDAAGARVVPTELPVPCVQESFNAAGELIDEELRDRLSAVMSELLLGARRLAPVG
jgi:hypothetical protein